MDGRFKGEFISCNMKFKFSSNITSETYVSSFARKVIWVNWRLTHGHLWKTLTKYKEHLHII